MCEGYAVQPRVLPVAAPAHPSKGEDESEDQCGDRESPQIIQSLLFHFLPFDSVRIGTGQTDSQSVARISVCDANHGTSAPWAVLM